LDSELTYRPEQPSDYSAIKAVGIAAFGTPAEANLVDTLRENGSAVLSLIAVRGSEVIGHVMLSRMLAPERTVGLAPVAVLAEFRRQGIAASLINLGLKQLQADGWDAAFVFGGPYYTRFGFSQPWAAGYVSKYSGPHLMGLELKPGALAGRLGPLDYPAAFDSV
jgi:putative acetyltransferase